MQFYQNKLNFTYKFIVSGNDIGDDIVRVALENDTYKRLSYKTFAYFSLPFLLNYTWIAKMDTDTYAQIANIQQHLYTLPSHHLYFGWENVHRNKRFMGGMFYLVTSDVLEKMQMYNATALLEEEENEDQFFYNWLTKTNYKVRTNKCAFWQCYNYDRGHVKWQRHSLHPKTLFVHHVDTSRQLKRVHQYFESSNI